MDFNASSGEDYYDYQKEDRFDSELEDRLNFEIETLQKERKEIREEARRIFLMEGPISKEEIDKLVRFILNKVGDD